MSLALIGLGALLAASALTFTALKWLGAIYLIWLGINMLRTAVRLDFNAACSNTRSTPHSLFYKLFWITVLNLKSIGFFVAFLPQFTDPAGPVGQDPGPWSNRHSGRADSRMQTDRTGGFTTTQLLNY